MDILPVISSSRFLDGALVDRSVAEVHVCNHTTVYAAAAAKSLREY